MSVGQLHNCMPATMPGRLSLSGCPLATRADLLNGAPAPSFWGSAGKASGVPAVPTTTFLVHGPPPRRRARPKFLGPMSSIGGIITVLSRPHVACPAAVTFAVSPPAAPGCDLFHGRRRLNGSPDFTGIAQRRCLGGYGCDGEQSGGCASNDPVPEHTFVLLPASFVAVRVERDISCVVRRGECRVDHCSSHTRERAFRSSRCFLFHGHEARSLA